jgi:hypothetical protein
LVTFAIEFAEAAIELPNFDETTPAILRDVARGLLGPQQ